MNASDDEYAAFDFSEFTEDDLKQIDADVARKAQGGPKVSIELAALEFDALSPKSGCTSTSVDERRKGVGSGLSPLEQYRRGGALWVTDLASLAWCEVQFDYGLRQQRSGPIASRPDSFVSAKGKEIFVEKAVAAQNDQTTKQGRAIHKQLEREIKLEELQVDITSEEEQWALRLVNMLACLRCIVLEGFTREMPVFGVLQDEVVFGIIDEVLRRPQSQLISHKRQSDPSPATPKLKKPRRSTSPAQPLITEFLPGPSNDPTSASEGDSSPNKVEGASPPPLNTSSIPPPPAQSILHLIDTKTRRTNSLPSHQDTLSSRIQLMLYYRLLRDLTSTSPPFDFASFWRRLDLDPLMSFSTRFLIQAGLVTENDKWTTSCLNDLVKAWVEMVQALHVCGVDKTLQIIYRLQPQGPRWKARNKGKGKMRAQNGFNVTQEELDLARAIEASLHDLSGNPSRDTGVSDVLQAKSNGVILVSTSVEEAPTVGFEARGSLSEKEVSSSDVNGHSNPNQTPLPSTEPQKGSGDNAEIYDMSIIGVKEFIYEEQMLNDHIMRALQWWHGDREPQGVSLEDARRCRSCEYESHCEWREQKALEVKERTQGR